MRRGVYLLALAAVVLALAASTAAATTWYHNWQPIPAGETVSLPLTGAKITVTFKPFKQTAVKFVCSDTGTASFWNEPAAGRDEVTSLTMTCPEGDSVSLVSPWRSTLLEGEPPLHDRQEGVMVNLVYVGVNQGVFTGTLEPPYGDVDPLTEREKEVGHRDEPDSYLTFRNFKPASPLTGPGGNELWFLGITHVGSKEAFITDENGVF